MSRVIKNNDGVAVVEGTPAASLVKDGEKFFDSKPPERMAGESIGQPRKIDESKIMSQAEYEADATRRIKEGIKRGIQLSPEPYSSYLERQQPGYKERQAAARQKENELRIQSGDATRAEIEKENELRARFERNRRAETSLGKSPSVDSSSRRNEAKDKAESRRVRSKMESERSQEEQEATKGKFITTLGR